jgi:hypothetical protein
VSEVIDDYREFTVSVYMPAPEYPIMVITGVEAPSAANPGDQIEIVVNWRNDGEAGTAWYRILDIDSGTDILPKTTWAVSKGESGSKVVSMTMPSRSIKLRVEIGHVE